MLTIYGVKTIWLHSYKMTPYENKKNWRRKYPEKRNAERKKYYRKTQNARKSGDIWTDVEILMVKKHAIPDSELASKIGRSVQAIQIKRSRLKEQ